MKKMWCWFKNKTNNDFKFFITVIAVCLLISWCVKVSAKTYCFDPVAGSLTNPVAACTLKWAENYICSGGMDSIAVAHTLMGPGDVLACKPGNYTVPAASIDRSTEDGTTSNLYTFVGVKAACSDTGIDIDSADFLWGDSANFPHWVMGGKTYTFGDYPMFRFFHVRGSGFDGGVAPIIFPVGHIVNFCVFKNDTSVSANKYAVSTTDGAFEFNIVIANNVKGLIGSGTVDNNLFIGNRGVYGLGVVFNTGVTVLKNNIINNWTRGVSIGGIVGGKIDYNSFFACSTAVYVDAGKTYIRYNAMDSCKKYGIYSATNYRSNVIRGNHGNNDRNVNMYSAFDVSGLYSKASFSTSGVPGWAGITVGNDSLTTDVMKNAGLTFKKAWAIR